MKINKKINILFASLLTVAGMTQTANAQTNIGQCAGASISVDEILTGPQFNTLVRMSSGSCGVSGFVCFSTENGADTTVSNRAFAAALTAQATEATNILVRWDNDTLGCGGDFPMVFDFRVRS